MRTIIAGSRDCDDYFLVESAVAASGFNITTVISGTARGVDQLGERWARENGIPVERYPADWEGLGKRAGYVRNVSMAERAEALIAVWDQQSRGTQHMIRIANNHGLHVFVFPY